MKLSLIIAGHILGKALAEALEIIPSLAANSEKWEDMVETICTGMGRTDGKNNLSRAQAAAAIVEDGKEEEKATVEVEQRYVCFTTPNGHTFTLWSGVENVMLEMEFNPQDRRSKLLETYVFSSLFQATKGLDKHVAEALLVSVRNLCFERMHLEHEGQRR